MIFRTLSRDEYERLTSDQKLDYLQRLMQDIGEKAMVVRQAIQHRKQDEAKPS